MRKIFPILLLLAVICFAGCMPAEWMLRDLPEDPSAPLVVAAMLPLSGENRVYAEQMREGLMAAESVINSRRGVSNRQLKVEFFDTCGTSAGTLAAIEKVQQSNAVAAVAGYGTEEVNMIIAHADRLHMPMVIPMATSDYHVQSSPFVYRNCFSDTQQMEALAAYLIYWRNVNIAAVITDCEDDEEYARGISRNFTQAMQDSGGRVTLNVTIPETATLKEEQLRSILMTEPQVVMVSAGNKRAAQWVKELREAGFRGVICGPDSWDDREFIAALEGSEPGECIFTAFFYEDNDLPEYLSFRKSFRKRFYHYPSACETQSYDALIFLCIGLNNVDNILDFDRNWRTIRNYRGAAAVYTMLPKGGIDRTIYLKSIGVNRAGDKKVPYSRLSRKLQYSKLQDYRIIE